MVEIKNFSRENFEEEKQEVKKSTRHNVDSLKDMVEEKKKGEVFNDFFNSIMKDPKAVRWDYEGPVQAKIGYTENHKLYSLRVMEPKGKSVNGKEIIYSITKTGTEEKEYELWISHNGGRYSLTVLKKGGEVDKKDNLNLDQLEKLIKPLWQVKSKWQEHADAQK